MKNELISELLSRSCDDCIFQVSIHKHPWNNNEYSKGKISEIIAYGCMMPDDNINNKQRIIMFDHDCGTCEMYTEKNND